MTNVNTAIYDKTIDRAAMIRLYEQNVAGKASVIIDGHSVRLVDLIKSNKAKLTPELRELIDKELFKTYNQLHDMSSRSLLDLVNDQVSYTYQKLETVVSKVWRTAKPQRRIAEEIVLKKPLYNDVTLAKGWAAVSLNEKKRLEQLIRKGISEGLSENEIALQLRKGNVFSISRNQSIGLVRTAITSVYTQADHEVYMANKPLLQGWQYVAVLDSRTTPLCAHRDGTVYPLEDTSHLPPAHWYCRSTTVPVVKRYSDLASMEGIAQIRKRNLSGLSEKQIAEYDGMTPLKESYSEWLFRQPKDVQLRHLGSDVKYNLFNSGQLTVDKFSEDGRSASLQELRELTSSGYAIPGTTKRFAAAKEKLDRLHLGVARPDDFYSDTKLVENLKEYYKLQVGELDGTLSLTNYRGVTLGAKKATKSRVLNSPPTEQNLIYNPITGRYDDARMYQPNQALLENNLRLVRESTSLKDADKKFITNFVNSLDEEMGANERATISDNLRIIFTRFRDNKEPWANFKAVAQSQIKFDVMNSSDYIETQLRRESNLLQKLKQDAYLDPVLGPTQLQELHDNFIDNVHKKNAWEDSVAPKIGKELRNILDRKLPPKLWIRLDDKDLDSFYTRFANRLSLDISPDRDQLAVALGRDLYNSANYRGSRRDWYNLGVKLLNDAQDKGFYRLESYGVQKRRMKSRNGNRYFGPYYDTNTVVIRVTDKRLREYSQLTRKVDIGLRISVTNDKNVLKIREGYKTYFDKHNRDTRIPITSTSSFSDFPVDMVDKNMADALNWAANTKYKVDPEFHDFIEKLMNFRDDKGKAEFYDSLNSYREYIVERGDSYERFKAMGWLRQNDTAFSNHPFLDHRGRIYDRGLISPQSGETFRPFLSTATQKNFSVDDFGNLQDQIGSFLGGLTDKLEGKYNSLSVLGRQEIAKMWRKELVAIGNSMRRAKPQDIRNILESPFMQLIDGEEQGKAFRFALEMSKIDEYLKGDYSKKSLATLSSYRTGLALEQDASSSGAQIIALTTKNKQLAELSNVVPTTYKKRLYDEIAASTFADPRFKQLNLKLGLTEKDLRKAAKAQNMVTFYGAGEKTGIMNVEAKLSKALGKDTESLVIKAADRDTVLNEISARMARYEKFDMDMYEDLKALRQDVKDVFNKGLPVGDEMMDQLYFLDSKTMDLVEKMTRQYNKIITPDDFKTIANIMSENLASQVPILKDFTRFFGRLAEDFVTNAKPSKSSIDYESVLERAVLGAHRSGKRLPRWLSRILAIKDEPIRDKFLRRIPGWVPGGPLDKLLFGSVAPTTRRTGFKIGEYSLFSEDILKGVEVLYPNKLEKSWTHLPWVNFDGKIVEQHFLQEFEEKLVYKTADGKWVTNIVQVKQKTDPTWWEELRNKSGKINEIVDAQKARTAFAVNGNHSKLHCCE